MNILVVVESGQGIQYRHIIPLAGGGSSRAWTILNQAMLGSYSTQISLPVSGLSPYA